MKASSAACTLSNFSISGFIFSKNTGKTFFLIPLVLTIMTDLHAQYYPGGLGNANLRLWLTAADQTTLQKASGAQAASGDFVAKWVDKSGNNNDATQATTGIRPVNQTSLLNGNDGVVFQNANEWLSGPSDAYQTIIGVRNLSGTGHYQSFFASPAHADFSIRGAGDGSGYTDGPNVNDWSYNTGTPPTQWLNGVQTLNGSTANQIIVSTAQAPTNSTYSINSTFLGRGMNGNDAVYEILGYDTPLNTTQRKILELYEATTWGLESLLPASGYPAYSPPVASTYKKNLIGIGYSSGTDNFLTTPDGSTDGLGFSSTKTSTGFLKTTGFLMAAHNGQVNSVLSNVSLPGISSLSHLSRWKRSWYIQKTGGYSAGNISLYFDFSGYNSSTPSISDTYALLYNASDGGFASGTNQLISTTSSISGTTVVFKVVASSLPSGFYSILYSSSPIVLPVLLEGFEAKAQSESVLLTWSTAQEKGIDHFTIERAGDAVHFAAIGTVSAEMNGQTDNDYHFTDAKPGSGPNYYRLKMIDQDGNMKTSAVRVVDLSADRSVKLNIYPNPVTDRLHINFTRDSGQTQIRISDLQGHLLRTINTTAEGTIEIPVNDLGHGVYILAVSTGNSKFVRKFMKN